MWSSPRSAASSTTPTSAAVKRFSELEAAGKPVPAKDQALKADMGQVGRRRQHLAQGGFRRPAEAERLARHRGAEPVAAERRDSGRHQVRRRDGTKEILLDASVKPPDGPDGDKNAQGDAAAREDQGRDRQGRHRPVDRHLHRAGVRLLAGHAGGGARHLVRLEPAAPRSACRAAGRRRVPTARSTWPFEFRWKGAGPDNVVRIHVLDEAERPLAGFEGRGDHLAAPDSLKSMLRAGRPLPVARRAGGRERRGSRRVIAHGFHNRAGLKFCSTVSERLTRFTTGCRRAYFALSVFWPIGNRTTIFASSSSGSTLITVPTPNCAWRTRAPGTTPPDAD